MMAVRGTMPWHEMSVYVLAQVVGCCLGAVLAHAMFGLPWLQSGDMR